MATCESKVRRSTTVKFGSMDASVCRRSSSAFCEGLRRRVREETGLIASVGAGSGKQVAKIASALAKPDGIRVVSRAEEQLLLGGLPVRRLWGIGPVAEERLNRLGIETIGELAAPAMQMILPWREPDGEKHHPGRPQPHRVRRGAPLQLA